MIRRTDAPELEEFFAIIFSDRDPLAPSVLERDETQRREGKPVRVQVFSAAAWGSGSARIGVVSEVGEDGRPLQAWAAKPVGLAPEVKALGIEAGELHMVLVADVPESSEAMYTPMRRFIVGHVRIAGRPVLARMSFLGHSMDVEIDLANEELTEVEREVLGNDVLKRAHGFSLSDLAHLFGNEHDPGSELEWLPESLRAVDLLTLDAIRFTVDPRDDRWLTRMGVTAGFARDKRWGLIPGFDFLTVGDLHTSIDVRDPLDPQARFPNVSVGGTLALGEAEIEIRARWPDMAVEGRLRTEDGTRVPVRLGALFDAVGLPALSQTGAKISSLSFEARPLSVKPTFSFSGRVDDVLTFAFAGTTFSLENVDAAVALERDGEDSVSARIAGTLRLGEHRMRLFAQTRPSEPGWEFGGWLVDQPLSLTAFGEWVTSKFGDQPLPGSLLRSDPKIDELGLRLHTARGDASFSLGTSFALAEGIEGVLRLEVALAHQGDGRFERSVGGRFELGAGEDQHLFELLLAQDGEDDDDPTNVLVASYLHDGKATMGDLLRAVGLDFDVPLELSGALLARSGGATLCTVDVGAGFDLRALPFVGRMLPGAPTLSLSLRVVVPSAGWDATRVEAVNRHLPSGYVSLSPVDGEGDTPTLQPSLVVTLGVGDTQQSLDLGLGLEPVGGDGAFAAPETLPVAADASKDDAQWVSVHQKLGPVQLRRLGAAYDAESKSIELLLDGDVNLGGLTLSLDGLSVRTPIDGELQPSFGLRGLGLDIRQGPLRVGGAFLKVPGRDEFVGTAVLETETFALSAIGAYGNFGGDPSMFLYAVLDYPLGGPSFFFVTGLAAGFGYNRALVMPEPDAISEFPLVKEAMAGARGAALPTGEGIIAKLSSFSSAIPYKRGEYFLAVGIKFNSFKIIDSFALLIASFGSDFRLDVLGESTLVSPPWTPGSNVAPLAEIRMGFRAQFVPSQGFLGLDARIAPGSYVLSKDCHISGGYAFYSWFSGKHAGDFVVTLGGYHPRFAAPDHYPKLPRAQIRWKVSKHVEIKGSLYYALTSRAMMCGGQLSATYVNGSAKAWFNASADFLMAWKPFAYDARLSVSVGARWKFLSAEVGAEVHLWGPEFSGRAKIHWSFVSFTIEFGSGAPATVEPLRDWATFAKSFLPEAPLSVACTEGLEGTVEGDWAVRGSGLVLTVTSQVPATEGVVSVAQRDAGAAPAATLDRVVGDVPLGVAPMGVGEGGAQTPLEVTVHPPPGSPALDVGVTAVRKNLPAALWGRPVLRPSVGDINEAGLVDGALCGLTLQVGRHGPRADAQSRGFSYDEKRTQHALREGGPTLPDATAEDMPVGDRVRHRADLLRGLGLDPSAVRHGVDRDHIFRARPRTVDAGTNA